ncbi:hypothetical protein LZ30DRAFT_710131 [Colletotrichum cereale]|nr:hypothetical protein LZ30DRAFT_710131 [Colletotrichum cereale]
MKLTLFTIVAVAFVGVQAGCWCSVNYRYSEHYTKLACRKLEGGPYYLNKKAKGGPECPKVVDEDTWLDVSYLLSQSKEQNCL